MTSRDLHDRAIGTAKADGDLDWLWHLLRSIPTAEDEVGDLEDSGMDMLSTVSAINGYARADRDLPGDFPIIGSQVSRSISPKKSSIRAPSLGQGDDQTPGGASDPAQRA